MSETLGIGLNSWPRDLRHVRDFIRSAGYIGRTIGIDELQEGDITIFQKIIPVEGKKDFFPCHMALVSNVCEGAISIVNTSVKSGFVVEQEMTDWQRGRFVLGIDLDTEKLSKLVESK